MPQIQGPELMRSLRSQGFLTPVMFLTGAATKEMAMTALRLGAADLIEKPFKTDELLQSIERVLELEKRKAKLYLDFANREVSKENIDKQKKMIGLLHVVNSKKS
jgi:FixJ family two-component response regulator